MSTAAAVVDDTASRSREFQFRDEDFNALRTLVRQLTGISLSEAKRELVYGRLSRRLRALGLQSFSAYRDLLANNPEGPEMVEFVNAITTNLTSFFRESHHFDHLRDHVLLPLLKGGAVQRRRGGAAGGAAGGGPGAGARAGRGPRP